MTKKEIQSRNDYLQSLRAKLSLEDNAAVAIEMTARAKQIEGLIKALNSANVNCDNIPGMEIYPKLEKSLVVKKYLKDLFFFDTLKLKKDATDQILVAKADLGKFAKGEDMDARSNETYQSWANEFSKVIDQVNACLNYYQIENINVVEEYDKPVSKLWIQLVPSEYYLEYLKRIKFVSFGKFFSTKK